MPSLTPDAGRLQSSWQWAYSAFGDDAPPLVQYNLRYPGQYFDEESGLHYNHFRSYDPKNGGRYTQADPIGLEGGWNRFGYVGADPLSYWDKYGLDKMNLFNPNSILINQKGLYMMANTFPDRQGELLIFAHANNSAIADDSKGGFLFDSRNAMNADELAKFIQDSGRWKSGMPIILYGCETAAGEDSIAKKLSEKLNVNVNVTGFPTKITFDPKNGRAVPSNPITFLPGKK
ncbi:RHS repeat-associated core domain-containing protein [Acidovorax sp. Leaf76]|uniref:RHS repeat-associated core domain-containing protein n=1 Tax=Acidovorax sp. Leaf76 TaxID=1736236 RepID=UPI0009EADE48|nr:RHS repeat-associated core domain-containing protein [Acidovorax sp. Leaf76]